LHLLFSIYQIGFSNGIHVSAYLDFMRFVVAFVASTEILLLANIDNPWSTDKETKKSSAQSVGKLI